MHHRILHSLLILLSFVLTSAATAGGLIEGVKAVGVYDGDTPYLVFPENPRHVRVRLAEIDAPEADQVGGMESKETLKSLILGEDLSVSIVTYDRYDRPVVEIYVGEMYVNAEMVRRGQAWAYDRYVTHPQMFVFHDEAQAAARGLWSGSNPIAPWEFRRMRR